jgi:hypothetical protein
MLGIIAELHHIELPVVGLKQVRLRAAAHLSDMAAGVQWHAWIDLLTGPGTSRCEKIG